MIAIWLKGLLTRRLGRVLGTVVGVALTVGLLADLGAFLVASSASMLTQAAAGVPVDWQILLASGADPSVVAAAVGKALAFDKMQPVGYADVAGFEAHTGGTVQTTGLGKVIGLDSSYRRDFPGQIRSLIGASDGVLVAQQTAANLHVAVGDRVTMIRVGLAAVEVRIDGVVDLPNADSMFQAIGLPPGAAPQAPPDNVVLLPMVRWHELFDPQAAIRPDSVREQLHVGLQHERLFPDPEAAYVQILNAARNLEARIAGSGVVADNLAARLDAVRSDALYVKVLFLFLGAPGALLAMLLSVAVASSASSRRRKEQALLRTRGASLAQILGLATAEALFIGTVGIIVGLLVAYTFSVALLHVPLFDRPVLPWLIAAALAGLLATGAAVMIPAWVDARELSVMHVRSTVETGRRPLWQRAYLDLIFLTLSGILFWQTESTGYQVVLAPEGVPASSVDYHAFLAPVLLWIGVALLAIRLLRLSLGIGRQFLSRVLRPIGGLLSNIVAASLSRQRDRVTRGIVLVVVAISFAVSTAVFDTTYNAQSRIDAELTNGADVTVTGTSAAPAGNLLATLAGLPGVNAAQSMQHRFAYVGTDLQDLYGIDAAHIGEATRMSNAYFQSGDAAATLAALASTPDGILVSAETVNDFQLQAGDRINLRLLRLSDHQYHTVPFRLVGVVREFPTAPRDSFLVANAAYVGRQTGSAVAEIALLRTSDDPARVATAARRAIQPAQGFVVTDVNSTLKLIGSSLTAVDLKGLTRLELAFAILMVLGSAGVVFALNLADGRRSFVILSALGAKRRQIGAFIWSEGLLIFAGGSVVGLLTGFAVAQMLVKLLTGVFDPPPQGLNVPWAYLALLISSAFAATAAAVFAAQAAAQASVTEGLREL